MRHGHLRSYRHRPVASPSALHHGWLMPATFSFASYHEPSRMGWGASGVERRPYRTASGFRIRTAT